MDLGYRSPSLLGQMGLRLETPIRSFGTLYLFNQVSCDFSFMVSCNAFWRGNTDLSIGAGIDWRLRLAKYLRASAPTASRLSLLPEATWYRNNIGLFIRSELGYLVRYSELQSGWTWNNFAPARAS